MCVARMKLGYLQPPTYSAGPANGDSIWVTDYRKYLICTSNTRSTIHWLLIVFQMQVHSPDASVEQTALAGPKCMHLVEIWRA